MNSNDSNFESEPVPSQEPTEQDEVGVGETAGAQEWELIETNPEKGLTDIALTGEILQAPSDDESSETPPPPDPRFSKEKSKIEKGHLEICKGMAAVVLLAADTGKILLSVKQAIPKGQFHFWLKSNFCAGRSALSIKTAQRYMTIAEKLPLLLQRLKAATGATRVSQTDSDEELLVGVSLRTALRLITDNAPSPDAPPPKRARKERKATAPERGDDEVSTPAAVLEATLALLDEIDLDPCGSESLPDHVPAKVRWTIADDGLGKKRKWIGRAFIHPPHSTPERWVRRALIEFRAQHLREAVILIPAICDEIAFLDLHHFPHAFIRERLAPLPFPALAVFLGSPDRTMDFAACFSRIADTFVPVLTERAPTP